VRVKATHGAGDDPAGLKQRIVLLDTEKLQHLRDENGEPIVGRQIVKGDFRLLVWLRAHFGIGAALLSWRAGLAWRGVGVTSAGRSSVR
jgi:hypothetical protein